MRDRSRDSHGDGDRRYDESLPTTSVTKRRATLTKLPNGYFRNVSRNLTTGAETVTEIKTDNAGIKSLNGTQVTESENHPNWNRTGRPASKDDGGPFFMQQKFAIFPNGISRSFTAYLKDVVGGVSTTTDYQGPILPYGDLLNGNMWPAFQHSSKAQLNALGTTAVARCKPSQPNADLATALIELRREGLPKLAGVATWKGKTARARKKAAGGEYLNVEFGWKPLVNDIVDTAVTLVESDSLINQYEKDSNKQVRRTYEFPLITVESETVMRNNVTPLVLGGSGGAMYNNSEINKGRVIRRRLVTKRCWFSGAFIYHLPIDLNTMEETRDRRRSLSKLIGLDLTPETVWNVAPWSWAVDWAANIGDIISNLQSWSTDGMVMRYGYIMEHTKCSDTYSFSGVTGFRNHGVVCPEVVLVSETKQRQKASPFSFGQPWGSFTPRQWAIVAALGISRSS